MRTPLGRFWAGVVCAVVAYGCFMAGVQVVRDEGRAIGAAYGWSGEAGQVTVTHGYQGRRDELFCYGRYESGDGVVLEKVRLHTSQRCETGRVADVRWAAGERGWPSMDTVDHAYEDAGIGSGTVTSLFTLVFGSVLVFGLGALSGLVGISMFGMLVIEARRRRRSE